MGRLSEVSLGLKDQNKKAFVAYVVAGDPHPDMTVQLMHRLVKSGVNIIELGVPFTDPEAEGPVIQAAHERALAHQVNLEAVLTMVARFRSEDAKTPVVLMGYLNPIERMGYKAFSQRAGDAGVDGLITVNLPPEEAGDLTEHLQTHGIDPIYLLAPTTNVERAQRICQASKGFVYYVSLKGTTGSGSLDVNAVQQKVNSLRDYAPLPLYVGFGIRDGETAGPIAAIADGVVVGSAIVALLADAEEQGPETVIRDVVNLTAEIRAALDASVS